jgi:hypothetical protein
VVQAVGGSSPLAHPSKKACNLLVLLRREGRANRTPRVQFVVRAFDSSFLRAALQVLSVRSAWAAGVQIFRTNGPPAIGIVTLGAGDWPAAGSPSRSARYL